MIGTIIGDIIGSPYEGLTKQQKKETFPLFSKYSRFTDDTVMTIAVMDACIKIKEEESQRGFFCKLWRKAKICLHFLDEDQEKMKIIENSLRCYGGMYPDAGYGYGFIQWLNNKNMGPYNSYGNGSAMRVSAIPWIFNDINEVRHIAKLSAAITHNHPEGIKGAEAVACAIFLAGEKKSKDEIKKYVEKEFGYNLSKTADEIRKERIISTTCMDTIPESMIAFLDSNSFEDAIRNAVSFGGDTDTIAAITGGIAEVYYEKIPAEMINESYSRLPEHLYLEIERFMKYVYHII